MQTVLVTGAAGCAGRHLCELALSSGADVHGIVRSRFTAGNLTTYVGDITNSHFVETVVQSVKPDWVFHLAAIIPARSPAPSPFEYYSVNILGTHNVLQSVRQHCPRARVLIASSSAVYGQPDDPRDKVSEQTPFRPQSVYAFTKVAQDWLGEYFFNEYGTHVVRVRTFNQTGPGEPSGLVVATLAKQISDIERGLQKPELRVRALAPSRDFTDVRDVVRGYWAALELGSPGDAYNLCSEQARSVDEVARMMIALSHVPAIRVVETGPLLSSPSIISQIGNCSKLRSKTGWKPQISIEDSLRDLLMSVRC